MKQFIGLEADGEAVLFNVEHIVSVRAHTEGIHLRLTNGHSMSCKIKMSDFMAMVNTPVACGGGFVELEDGLEKKSRA